MSPAWYMYKENGYNDKNNPIGLICKYYLTQCFVFNKQLLVIFLNDRGHNLPLNNLNWSNVISLTRLHS